MSLEDDVKKFYEFLRRVRCWKEESLEGVRLLYNTFEEEALENDFYKKYLKVHPIWIEEDEYSAVLNMIQIITERFEYEFESYGLNKD